MTATLNDSTRNGVDTATLFATRDAVKAAPEAVQRPATREQDLPWPRSDHAGLRIDLNWGRGAVTGCDAGTGLGARASHVCVRTGNRRDRSAHRRQNRAPITDNRQDRAVRGYLLPTKVTRVGPGSGVVPGGTLSSRLPAGGERGSFMACGLAGHRGEAWLKRGLLCS
jgi:hypothetical protein